MATDTRPRVPEGLRNLMKNLTRGILKQKPPNIYCFAENYFLSLLHEKENYDVKNFEPSLTKYDFSNVKTPQYYNVPMALAYSIIPEGLTELIKEIIKAVLREQPQNLCEFALEYFRHLRNCNEGCDSKEITYDAYENYFRNKERFMYTPFVKCFCGRFLGQDFGIDQQINGHSPSFVFSNIGLSNTNKCCPSFNECNDTQKIVSSDQNNHSARVIQRCFRKYLEMKQNKKFLPEREMNEETAATIIQKSIKRFLTYRKGEAPTKPREILQTVPHLQLNQLENDNVSEEASYTSASTAILSASEVGRDFLEIGTAENIVKEPIIETEEHENDEENSIDYKHTIDTSETRKFSNNKLPVDKNGNHIDSVHNENISLYADNNKIGLFSKSMEQLLENDKNDKSFFNLEASNKSERNLQINNSGEGVSNYIKGYKNRQKDGSQDVDIVDTGNGDLEDTSVVRNKLNANINASQNHDNTTPNKYNNPLETSEVNDQHLTYFEEFQKKTADIDREENITISKIIPTSNENEDGGHSKICVAESDHLETELTDQHLKTYFEEFQTKTEDNESEENNTISDIIPTSNENEDGEHLKTHFSESENKADCACNEEPSKVIATTLTFLENVETAKIQIHDQGQIMTYDCNSKLTTSAVESSEEPERQFRLSGKKVNIHEENSKNGQDPEFVTQNSQLNANALPTISAIDNDLSIKTTNTNCNVEIEIVDDWNISDKRSDECDENAPPEENGDISTTAATANNEQPSSIQTVNGNIIKTIQVSSPDSKIDYKDLSNSYEKDSTLSTSKESTIPETNSVYLMNFNDTAALGDVLPHKEYLPNNNYDTATVSTEKLEKNTEDSDKTLELNREWDETNAVGKIDINCTKRSPNKAHDDSNCSEIDDNSNVVHTAKSTPTSDDSVADKYSLYVSESNLMPEDELSISKNNGESSTDHKVTVHACSNNESSADKKQVSDNKLENQSQINPIVNFKETASSNDDKIHNTINNDNSYIMDSADVNEEFDIKLEITTQTNPVSTSEENAENAIVYVPKIENSSPTDLHNLSISENEGTSKQALYDFNINDILNSVGKEISDVKIGNQPENNSILTSEVNVDNSIGDIHMLNIPQECKITILENNETYSSKQILNENTIHDALSNENSYKTPEASDMKPNRAIISQETVASSVTEDGKLQMVKPNSTIAENKHNPTLISEETATSSVTEDYKLENASPDCTVAESNLKFSENNEISSSVQMLHDIKILDTFKKENSCETDSTETLEGIADENRNLKLQKHLAKVTPEKPSLVASNSKADSDNVAKIEQNKLGDQTANCNKNHVPDEYKDASLDVPIAENDLVKEKIFEDSSSKAQMDGNDPAKEDLESANRVILASLILTKDNPSTKSNNETNDDNILKPNEYIEVNTSLLNNESDGSENRNSNSHISDFTIASKDPGPATIINQDKINYNNKAINEDVNYVEIKEGKATPRQGSRDKFELSTNCNNDYIPDEYKDASLNMPIDDNGLVKENIFDDPSSKAPMDGNDAAIEDLKSANRIILDQSNLILTKDKPSTTSNNETNDNTTIDKLSTTSKTETNGDNELKSNEYIEVTSSHLTNESDGSENRNGNSHISDFPCASTDPGLATNINQDDTNYNVKARYEIVNDVGDKFELSTNCNKDHITDEYKDASLNVPIEEKDLVKEEISDDPSSKAQMDGNNAIKEDLKSASRAILTPSNLISTNGNPSTTSNNETYIEVNSSLLPNESDDSENRNSNSHISDFTCASTDPGLTTIINQDDTNYNVKARYEEANDVGDMFELSTNCNKDHITDEYKDASLNVPIVEKDLLKEEVSGDPSSKAQMDGNNAIKEDLKSASRAILTPSNLISTNDNPSTTSNNEPNIEANSSLLPKESDESENRNSNSHISDFTIASTDPVLATIINQDVINYNTKARNEDVNYVGIKEAELSTNCNKSHIPHEYKDVSLNMPLHENDLVKEEMFVDNSSKAQMDGIDAEIEDQKSAYRVVLYPSNIISTNDNPSTTSNNETNIEVNSSLSPNESDDSENRNSNSHISDFTIASTDPVLATIINQDEINYNTKAMNDLVKEEISDDPSSKAQMDGNDPERQEPASRAILTPSNMILTKDDPLITLNYETNDDNEYVGVNSPCLTNESDRLEKRNVNSNISDFTSTDPGLTTLINQDDITYNTKDRNEDATYVEVTEAKETPCQWSSDKFECSTNCNKNNVTGEYEDTSFNVPIDENDLVKEEFTDDPSSKAQIDGSDPIKEDLKLESRAILTPSTIILTEDNPSITSNNETNDDNELEPNGCLEVNSSYLTNESDGLEKHNDNSNLSNTTITSTDSGFATLINQDDIRYNTKGDGEKEKEATTDIGNNSTEAFIGNQNLITGRSKHGLLERFSDQAFAETHLRSFRKEHQMNNVVPLGISLNKESNNKLPQQKDVEKLVCETSTSNDLRMDDISTGKQENSDFVANLNNIYVNSKSSNDSQDLPTNALSSLEETVETRMTPDCRNDCQEPPFKSSMNVEQSSAQRSNISYERIPRYFHGIPTMASKENLLPKRKMYKDSMAFTIPFENGKSRLNEKNQPQNINGDIFNNKGDVDNVEDTDFLLEAESPTKLFDELFQFENDLETFDQNISQTIDDIIRLKNEDNVQQLDQNMDNLELREHMPDTVLHTIIELAEPEFSKQEECIFITETEKDISIVIDHADCAKVQTTVSFISKNECIDDFPESTIQECHISSNCKGNTILTEYEELLKSAPTPPNELLSDGDDKAHNHLTSVNEKLNQDKENVAARTIHRDVNDENVITEKSISASCTKEVFELDESNNDAKSFDIAATIIQSAFKEYIRRKNGDSIKNVVYNNTDINSLDFNVAATIIQKAYRNFRKKLNFMSAKEKTIDGERSPLKQLEQIDVHENVLGKIVSNTSQHESSINNLTSMDQGMIKSKQHDVVMNSYNKILSLSEAGTVIRSMDPLNIENGECNLNEFKINEMDQNGAAIIIQKAFRTFKQNRNRMLNDVTEKNVQTKQVRKNKYNTRAETDELQHNAAIIIQKNFKIYMKRKFETSKQSADISHYNLKDINAAKKFIENSEQGNVQTEEKSFEREIPNKLTEYSHHSQERAQILTEDYAAQIIQKCFRQYRRKKFNKIHQPTAENICHATVKPNEHEAAKIIQRAFRKSVKTKMAQHKEESTLTEIAATTYTGKPIWYVGDEIIEAMTPSETSFEETEAYVEVIENPPYVVGNASRSSLDTISDLSVAESTQQDHDGKYDSQKAEKSNEETIQRDAIKSESTNSQYQQCSPDIGVPNSEVVTEQFIDSERSFCEKVNQRDCNQGLLHNSELTYINEINIEFLNSERNLSSILKSYKNQMTDLTDKSKSLSTDISPLSNIVNDDSTSTDSENEANDSLGCKLNKLDETEEIIEKMKQRRDSTSTNENKYEYVKHSFEESSIKPLAKLESNMDTDEDCIVVTDLKNEESRESSAQSDVIICEGTEINQKDAQEVTSTTKKALKHRHTIATNSDIDSQVNIEEPITTTNGQTYDPTDSFYLDDDTSNNIRSKIMAYSLSEADSDCSDKNDVDHVGETKAHMLDNVSTALVGNGDTSTETESTIVSAVTKLQAGARGYLTRKRLGRTNDLKSIQCDESENVSFGNAAISESIEFLLREAAARKIQAFFKNMQRKHQTFASKLQTKESDQDAKSLDNYLAQKRSMLQRGVALRNNSTPDEGNSNEGMKLLTFEDQPATKGDTRDLKRFENNKRKWIAMRQNSMPVQIDSEVFRVIPKHMRKKVKSADGNKHQRSRKMLYD
ncbi:uncharacterized protein isoform X2 [Musca autumnalis]|uniref:uncharacterized protein isoform X2 n=1 Tax=Musca autumnalis TaxID=221902 RepID=UPI003CECF495